LTPATTQADATSTEIATTSSNSEAAAPGARRTQYPNVVVGSGIFMFAVSYMAATMFAEASTARIDRLLYVPVAGPWLDLARRPLCSGTACNTEFGNRALLVGDGILQDLGLLMTLVGLLSDHAPTEVQTAKVVETNARKVRVSPAAFGAGAYGVAAIGKF
jgi:hypothetical protein